MGQNVEMKAECGNSVSVAVDMNMFASPEFRDMLSPEAMEKLNTFLKAADYNTKVENFRNAQRAYRVAYQNLQEASVSDYQTAMEELRKASRERDVAEAEVKTAK